MAPTLVDQRGFAFHFPKLGLPDPRDPRGEDVLIRVAIGKEEEAISLVKDDKVKAPRRYAGDLYDYFDVQYEGAVWILPLVRPRSTGKELFSLKIRRVHPSTLRKPREMILPDGLTVCFMKHPVGMAELARNPAQNGETTEADEEHYWSWDWDALLHRETTSGPDATISVSCDPDDRQEAYDPLNAVKDEWQRAVKGLAITQKTKATGKAPRHEPELLFRSAVGNDNVLIQYTLVWQADINPHTIPEAQWETVPPYAYKPGCQLSLHNLARKTMGLQPLSQKEMEEVHVVAAAAFEEYKRKCSAS